MKFTQPRLPYAPDDLAPVISQTTIDYHYGKHEKAYIDTLNNAAQAWNHIFYFFQFSPNGLKEPGGKLRAKIDETFGSFEEFKKKFEEAGATLFGSGWVWLSADSDGKLFITQGRNAENPLTTGLKPILTFDVWEHAYYLDYQNLRAQYLHRLWDIIDWDIIEVRYGE